MVCVGSKKCKNEREPKFGFVFCAKHFFENNFCEKLLFGCLSMREQVKRLNLMCVLTSKLKVLYTTCMKSGKYMKICIKFSTHMNFLETLLEKQTKKCFLPCIEEHISVAAIES